MTWLAIAIWSVLALGACLLAFLIAVGQAFGRRSPARSFFVSMMLGVGLKLSDGNFVATILISWLLRAAAGAADIYFGAPAL